MNAFFRSDFRVAISASVNSWVQLGQRLALIATGSLHLGQGLSFQLGLFGIDFPSNLPDHGDNAANDEQFIVHRIVFRHGGIVT